MLIWLSLIIPIIACIYLLGWHRKATKWWELTVIFVVPILCIVGSKFLAEKLQTCDKEYWGFNTIRAENYEPYSYWSTCTETYVCGADSKGNVRMCTRTYPCVKRVPRKCYLINQHSQKKPVSHDRYKELAKRWKNNVFVELNRPAKEDIEDDGDMYLTKWDGKWQSSEPISEIHRYENRIQAASSVYNFPEVSEADVKKYQLYEYPPISGYRLPTILDHGRGWPMSDRYFQYLNGIYGPKRKLRVWVLVFRNQPIDAAKAQENHWKGGNKNEFIYCLGADKKGNVSWAEVISWTDQAELKVAGRDFAARLGKINEKTLMSLADFSKEALGSKFMRKDFREFNYLEVEPSRTSIIVTYVIVFLTTVGVCVWVVKNDHHDHQRHRRSYRRRW